MDKKTVLYIPNDNDRITIGCPAVIMHCINHTSKLVSNIKPIITSLVVAHNKVTEEFETENSLYKPYETH